MNTELILDLGTRLRARVPQLASYDLFNGQYDMPEKHDSWTTPAVFIEFVNATPDNVKLGVVYKQNVLRLHCVMNFLRGTANVDKAAAPKQQKKLEHYNFPRLVFAAVQGWKAPSTLSVFDWTNTEYDNSKPGMIVETIDFSFIDNEDIAYWYKNWVTRNGLTLNLNGNLGYPPGWTIADLNTEDGESLTT